MAAASRIDLPAVPQVRPAKSSGAVIACGEAPMRGARRVLVADLEHVMQMLASRKLSDAAVHEIRKELKRARAILRLLREALGKRLYRRENAALRDAMRPLTPARDAKVLLGAMDDLTKRLDTEVDSSGIPALRKRLRQERNRSRAELSAPKLASILDAVREVQRRIQSVPVRKLDSARLEQALGAALKKVRRARRAALHDASNERLHEWRKQAKHFLNQLLVVSPLQPGRLKRIAKRVHRLTDNLGDDHDMAMLANKLDEYARQDPAVRDARDAAATVAKARRARLQRKANRLAKPLDHEKPRPLRKRLARCASRWAAAPVRS